MNRNMTDRKENVMSQYSVYKEGNSIYVKDYANWTEIELNRSVCDQIYRMMDYTYSKEEVMQLIEKKDGLNPDNLSKEDIDTITTYYMECKAEGNMTKTECFEEALAKFCLMKMIDEMEQEEER